jgi:hypothetical protein
MKKKRIKFINIELNPTESKRVGLATTKLWLTATQFTRMAMMKQVIEVNGE